MKYEMKKLLALGRLLARSWGAPVGLSTICFTTAAAPDAKVVIKKTWMTWKGKYQDCTFSCAAAAVGAKRLASSMRMIGTNAMRTESRITGRSPVTTPMIALGIWLIHSRKKMLVSESMF